MKIGFYGKAFGSDYNELMREVLRILKESSVDIMIYESFFYDIRHCIDEGYEFELFNDAEEIKNNIDILFSFGGDGTILDSVPLIRDSGIPVLGINTGTLGFLASVSPQFSSEAVNNIIIGNYTIEQRSLIQIKDDNGAFNGINYALNEISICRKDNGSLLVVEVYIDDSLLNTYWADGIILATPTGSTAYSMSVGGPIMTPNADSFLITPIAAHNLSVRPVVIPDKSVVKVKVNGRNDKFALGLDSRIVTADKSMDIEIKKTDFTFNMINMPDKNFFETIRKKLLWGNDLRN
ncbi:MAG: NAD kinase [Bacteroidales bacterium]|nr:NAD kinase [Bacteroidales bacterium]